MAYSPIGIPLPDLVVSAYSASVATWGSTLAVTANIKNITASSVIQPLSLEPGSFSTADAPASQLGVYLSTSPKNLSHAIEVGRIDVPIIDQNTLTVVSGTVTLPNRPAGFPGDGGKVYLFVKANDADQFDETDNTNNGSVPVPVKIEAPFPELSVVGFDVPPVISPGDTIQPNIRIANLGTAATSDQGTLQVALVASTTPKFNSGSKIVALYSVSNIPAQSLVPSEGTVLGDANQSPGNNIVTIAGDPVTLSSSPSKYYIGVVIDPYHHFKQIQTVPQNQRNATTLYLPHVVGPNETGLTPAGINYAGGTANVPVFPLPQNDLAVGGSSTGAFPPPLYPVSGSVSSSRLKISSASVVSTSPRETIMLRQAAARASLAAARAARHAAAAARHGASDGSTN